MKNVADYPLSLTAKEVAEIMRINKNTVYNMVQRNEIPYVKAGRKIRFARDRFFEWWNGCNPGA